MIYSSTKAELKREYDHATKMWEKWQAESQKRLDDYRELYSDTRKLHTQLAEATELLDLWLTSDWQIETARLTRIFLEPKEEE